MLALLRTRRWQGFTAVVIVAILGFGLLSRWQWSRAEDKRLEQQALAVSQLQPVTPGPMDDVAEFTAVTVTGTYDPDSRRLVRQRPLEGRNGFWVVEQLSTELGRLWVLRGWTPATARAQDSPDVPSIDSTPVTVEGFARPLTGGTALVDRGGLPFDQLTEINAAQLPDPGDMNWYLQARASQPADPLVPVPLPAPDEFQNISYAIQWLLFAGVAIAGWFFFLRREAREVRDVEQAPTDPI